MKRIDGGGASTVWVVLACIWATLMTSSMSRDLPPSQLDTVYIEGQQSVSYSQLQTRRQDTMQDAGARLEKLNK